MSSNSKASAMCKAVHPSLHTKTDRQTYRHTPTPTPTPTHIHTHTETETETHKRTCTDTHINTHRHTHLSEGVSHVFELEGLGNVQDRAPVVVLSDTHTRKHTDTDAEADTDTDTHKHTHTHKLSLLSLSHLAEDVSHVFELEGLGNVQGRAPVIVLQIRLRKSALPHIFLFVEVSFSFFLMRVFGSIGQSWNYTESGLPNVWTCLILLLRV